MGVGGARSLTVGSSTRVGLKTAKTPPLDLTQDTRQSYFTYTRSEGGPIAAVLCPKKTLTSVT